MAVSQCFKTNMTASLPILSCGMFLCLGGWFAQRGSQDLQAPSCTVCHFSPRCPAGHVAPRNSRLGDSRSDRLLSCFERFCLAGLILSVILTFHSTVAHWKAHWNVLCFLTWGHPCTPRLHKEYFPRAVWTNKEAIHSTLQFLGVG